MPENKKFWKFCNQAGNKVELLLYGDISQTSWWGDEVTPKQFAEELAGLGALDEITVRINSGGDVFAAQAIGNQLEQHPAAVTAKIDGLCASAATIHCHPYSSWKSGSNENANSMIRRRHPKGTDFSKVSAAEIADTEEWINNYPRKILGYKSSEVMFRECLREIGLSA